MYICTIYIHTYIRTTYIHTVHTYTYTHTYNHYNVHTHKHIHNYVFIHSGPKRYDLSGGRWCYLHDGVCLHDLLSEEFSQLLQTTIDLSQLNYSSIPNDADSWS